MAQEEGRVRQRHEGGQGGSEAHRGRRKDLRPPPAPTYGHVRLRPVPALRPEVQRKRRRSTHPKVQEHKEQQALNHELIRPCKTQFYSNPFKCDTQICASSYDFELPNLMISFLLILTNHVSHT